MVHDPRFAAARPDWRRKGGYGRSRIARAGKRMPQALKWMLDLMQTIVAETYTGDMQPARANALASVIAAYVKLYDAFEFGEQLDRLEKQMGVEHD